MIHNIVKSLCKYGFGKCIMHIRSMQLFTNTFIITPASAKLPPRLKSYMGRLSQNVNILTEVLYKILQIHPLKTSFKSVLTTFSIEKFPNNKFLEMA